MDNLPPTDQTLDLSEARVAYEAALRDLENALPRPPQPPDTIAIDPASVSWPEAILRAVLWMPLLLVQSVLRIVNVIVKEGGDFLRDFKNRLIRFAYREPVMPTGPEADFRSDIRNLLLEVLWARDHVQEAIERHNGASYASKRQVLFFVMANEARLQTIGQEALVLANLDTGDLRDLQPTAPESDRWWWFLNYPRAKRARRMNAVWFGLAIIPALASLVLITLLAQRLAINGPDLLSGASVVAQVGLGLGSILAGRELLNDLILRGSRVSWEGRVTFLLTMLCLVVIVIFYFMAPPGAAMVYSVFGQRAIDAGNAAEAELYLESAARLDPDPYAASLLEVGCLYQTLGSPDRAQTVYERVLEADSRLVLARFHLAEIYSDKGQYGTALQLLEDGLNLLDVARDELQTGNSSFLPGVDNAAKADQLEYLLRLARGRAYLDSDAPEQAKANLRDAEELFKQISTEQANGASTATNHVEISCDPDQNLVPNILSTQLSLHYHLARTYDALCTDQATIDAAKEEWRLVRNGIPSNSRQEAWRDDAVRRLSSNETCETRYGLENILGLTDMPSRDY
ncbi:MAG: hypothetical protein JXJ20_01820 [Anaerolineae bacterium]|nr:hypothetical protein [Anaerolineae bacterium]